MPSLSMDHAAGDTRAAATQRCRSVGVVVAAGMNHDRTPTNLLHSKMGGGDRLGRIAPTVHYQYREVATMAGCAERAQMLFGVARIVMATGGKACGWFALIPPGTAVALIVNMKSVATWRQPGELGRD
jgi:hypothetical protein